ncbi:hypothetical protein SAMN05444680_116108 [Variovorax sp. YR216]|nr:hypothetical protein SAMN05444680_116108 [Variovorax sp. YR216]
MEVLSRYVEFDERNLGVFSIELAHLLFAAASEVDVVAKLLCECVAPGSGPGNIDGYKAVLLAAIPDLPDAGIAVPRYGMTFKPWSSWGLPSRSNPEWWRSYNNVKHERDGYFHEATLKHALNALGGLLILTYHLYSRKLGPPGTALSPKVTTQQLLPDSTLLRLDGNFYISYLVMGGPS